ncbi:MAG: hypothetical protein NC203_12075 [Firmicutes bacterium]|nr:hypothetical protein [Bacillota bacterium]
MNEQISMHCDPLYRDCALFRCALFMENKADPLLQWAFTGFAAGFTVMTALASVMEICGYIGLSADFSFTPCYVCKP